MNDRPESHTMHVNLPFFAKWQLSRKMAPSMNLLYDEGLRSRGAGYRQTHRSILARTEDASKSRISAACVDSPVSVT